MATESGSQLGETGNMAENGQEFDLPDLSGLSEVERMQVIAVIQRAKDFEVQEEKGMRRPLEGTLNKYTNVMKGWQHRFFVLDPESGMLEYFEKEEHKSQKARGSVHLAGAVICPSDEDSQTFTVNAANSEIYRLRASDARERQHWVDRLRATSQHHTATMAQNAPPLNREARTGTCYTPNDLVAGRKPHSSQDNLHLSVISHVHRSQHKSAMPQSPVTDLFTDVREHLHEANDYAKSLAEKIEELPAADQTLNPVDKDLLLMKATSMATLQCLNQCLHILHQRQSINSSPSGVAPSRAVEWPDTRPPIQVDIPAAMSGILSPTGSFTSTSSLPYSVPDPKSLEPIDHNEEVEDPSGYTDTDLEGVEEHKSIILHLLSQLKLGMDLTKVVLPTFILERRSLLELFADCMAHPQLFICIADLPDPESRMLAVLEWYLTSFHAGRQGSVAKKPYNPIIGETFHCSWRLSDEETGASASGAENGENTGGEERSEGSEGEVQLTYCAEQVSHHPPISAFYFECPQKQMCMNASIYTKSKFMGMSIGLVMVGKVSLRLLAHDEEYVFSLPSVYARSILTIPWVELGDKVHLTCQKTNLSAAVTFHTKPFYGGKLHRVNAEVKDNTTGNITCKVQGEWNKSFEFTHAEEEPQTVNVDRLEIVRKRVRPLEKQGEFESRRLWQHVTNALAVGDVNTATEHKKFLEGRQREGERHRRETSIAYPTKFFHKEGEDWYFNQLLKKDQTAGSL